MFSLFFGAFGHRDLLKSQFCYMIDLVCKGMPIFRFLTVSPDSFYCVLVGLRQYLVFLFALQ